MAFFVHVDDLRLRDNPGLCRAAENGSVNPIFIDSSTANQRYGERFLAIREAALRSLQNEYREQGCCLSIVKGDYESVLRRLSEKSEVYINRTASNPEIIQALRSCDTDTVKIVENEPVRAKTAQQGNRAIHEYFSGQPLETPNLAGEDAHLKLETRQLRDEEPILPVNTGYVQKRFRLLRRTLRKYSSVISKPYLAAQHTTRLSQAISTGTISLRDAHRRTKNIDPESNVLSRYAWSLRFKQKLWRNPGLVESTLNPYFHQTHPYEENEELLRVWKQGRTGYPLVDASMRALNQTGYINFRMRAMVATFLTHILRQPWWVGAEYMHKQLIDAEPAINYYQWQMQAAVIGSHPLRIYDPVKQHRENDSNHVFVDIYVPELRGLDSERKFTPWKETLTKKSVPWRRVVNYEAEAKRTRAWFTKHRAGILEEFEDEDFVERLLLGEASKLRIKNAARSENQKGLDDFSDHIFIKD